MKNIVIAALLIFPLLMPAQTPFWESVQAKEKVIAEKNRLKDRPLVARQIASVAYKVDDSLVKTWQEIATFDRAQRPLAFFRIASNGDTIRRATHAYDTLGRLIEYEFYARDTFPAHYNRLERQYELQSGELLREVEENRNLKDTIIVFRYFENGRKIKFIEESGGSSRTCENVFSPTKEEIFMEKGEMLPGESEWVKKKVLQLDDRGRILKEVLFDAKNKEYKRFRYHYDVVGQVTKIETYLPGSMQPAYTTTIGYSGLGLPMKELKQTPEGVFLEQIISDYTITGQMTSSSLRSQDGGYQIRARYYPTGQKMLMHKSVVGKGRVLQLSWRYNDAFYVSEFFRMTDERFATTRTYTYVYHPKKAPRGDEPQKKRRK